MISVDNIKKVALWDLTINRSMYKKQLYSLLAFLGTFLFMHLGPQLFNLMFYGVDYTMEQYGSMVGKDYTMANMVIGLSFAFYILSQGNLTNVLITRQGRLNEFMLPASNSERFLWRTFMSVVVYAVAIVAGLVCYDLIQMFVHSVVFPGYDVQSIWSYNSFSLITNSGFDGRASAPGFFFFLQVAEVLSLIFIGSVYILGSTIKYKKSILCTTLFILLFLVVFSFLMVLVAHSSAGGLLEEFMYFLFENRGIFSWIKDYPWVISFFFSLVELLLIVWMWRKSYKNYCHAQLTTRMNP